MAHHKIELAFSKIEYIVGRNPHYCKFTSEMITFDHRSISPFKSEGIDHYT